MEKCRAVLIPSFHKMYNAYVVAFSYLDSFASLCGGCTNKVSVVSCRMMACINDVLAVIAPSLAVGPLATLDLVAASPSSTDTVRVSCTATQFMTINAMLAHGAWRQRYAAPPSPVYRVDNGHPSAFPTRVRLVAVSSL